MYAMARNDSNRKFNLVFVNTDAAYFQSPLKKKLPPLRFLTTTHSVIKL